MEVEIPLVYDAKCKTAYANETAVLIDNTVLCAGYLEGKKDSCRVFNFCSIIDRCTYKYTNLCIF